MPSSPQNDDKPQRRRRKETDRERDSTASSKEKQRSSTKLGLGLSSTKSYRRRSRSREREKDSPRSATSDRIARKGSVVVPEMERRPSGSDVRQKTSYPSFSKAHSREAIVSREDIAKTKSSTPEPEPVASRKVRAKRRNSTPANGVGPLPMAPSPPPDAGSQEMKRSKSGSSIHSTSEEQTKAETVNARKLARAKTASEATRGSTSTAATKKEIQPGGSEVSSMPGAFPEDERRSTPNSGYRATISTGSQPTSSVTDDSNPDSDATSIPENHRPKKVEISTSNVQIFGTDSEPKTPTPASAMFPTAWPGRIKTPVIEVERANAYIPSHSTTTSSLDPKTPMTAVPPPPPPPPPLVTGSGETPRVDYLLKNGGLNSLIPKRLVSNGPNVQQYSTYQTPSVGQMAPIEEYAKVFTGLHKRLDDYLYVLRHNGSLAVATGYKSVARRLLDKLSQVFARDISTQRCECVICRTTPQPTLSDEEDSGVSWGEILEFVAGRRELPQWPPFTIQPDDSGLGISGTTQAPMQKLDIDVPEEYKDHYIRQNQKTKKAVQNWLAQQPEYATSPPEEADEDTLMFAMMTKLDAGQRNYFIALMHGMTSISQTRAPTPAERPAASTPSLKRAAKALQRLYRLVRPPRDCESAMYLLNNPHLHNMLATLAEVNEQEWDILVSGRFDGFLWSGAEAPFPPSASGYTTPISMGPSRGPSRGPTPAANGYGASRNTTPFSGMSGMSFSRNQTPFSRGQTPFSRDQTPFSGLRDPTSFSDNNTPPQQLGGPTQHSVFPSRGPTPAGIGSGSWGGVDAPPPVQLDEETEIAVLGEVERNLFNDMERFEDAFEILHSRAELVRQLLRERSAGLAIQAQQRRGSNGPASGIVRLDTPASAATDFEDEGDDDDGLADLASLAPDDSASQISVNRRHHRKERRERRTPAPVVEEEESVFEEERVGSRYGRRSKY